ncbi:hypothetical protein AAF712_004474 [Marasmius tenuissimus]|uniref:Mandelate racemase/muconate lactonizing enzyme C-terminal domain-containing protein n=1 Tax=Marasmius tenuissimus TaxID=585030 RepID=A0ABR3A3D2_9AGAR
MSSSKEFPTITKIETFVVSAEGDGGDYHRQKQGHWIVDTPISNPMSGYEQYRHSRTSWGIGVLGSLLVTITASDGTQGFATGFGGPPACWLINEHFTRFVVGSDPRDTNRIWDQLFRASMFYGRKGITMAAISAVDLAIWDLLGKLRNEPVYKMIGGRTKDKIPFYCTGPLPTEARRMGFWGAKVPLPYSPLDGFDSMRKNLDFLKAHREKVGPDYPIMVDCYMSLNVQYAIEIAQKAIDEGININWWEEVLHPDDFDGHRLLKSALPQVKWTTGEHEYSRYGFRKLIEGRSVDIIQPDVMWLGGLTEAGLQFKFTSVFSPGGLLPSVNKAEIFQLAVNYRSHAGIVDCAHSVIDLINRFWPGSIDGLDREQGMSPGPQPIFFDGKGGNASVLSKYLFGDSGNRIEFGAQQCILVRDAEAKERLKEEMGDDIGLVLTIYDSKGLEFNDVLLYNFFEDSNADFARWRVILNAIGQSSVPLPKFDNNKHASIWLDLKFLYVALTRARENVWIADVSDKGEPMREYWTNRGLIRSMTPGMDAPQLASSSTSEEWEVRGKQLFHLKKYPEAKHCFERAKKPNYVLMADAYMLHDRAKGAEPGSRRKAAFQSAGAAFRRCSETFKTRRLEYLRLSAGCFRDAQEFQEAAKLFLEICYYGEAVECYLEVNMFDEAVKIVLRHRESLDSADSLPSSDPQRKVHLEQGCQLFDDSEDPVEYLEDRLLSGALGDVLVAAQRLDEAAELHWSEGRVIEAITLFFESQSEASSRRAAECVLEGLWQMLSFGMRTSESNGDLLHLQRFASAVDTELLDVNGRRELLMFQYISSPDTNRLALREAGTTFLAAQNLPAALLCLDCYFDNSPRFRNWGLTPEELAPELELFHVFAERLASTMVNASLR